MHARIMGDLSIGWSEDGEPFLVPLDELPLDVTVPEPALAVPDDIPPETSVPPWDPLPLRPTPCPAPDFMYYDFC